MDSQDNKQEAEQYKLEGNNQFKAKNYIKAIELYTNAISLFDQEPAYFGNRAACYLATKKYYQCIDDCNIALNLDPKQVKNIRRKAKSQMAQMRIDDAIFTYQNAIKIDFSDKSLQKELSDCQQVQRDLISFEVAYQKEQFKDAVLYINKIFTFLEDSDDLRIKQVECLAKIGMTDSANKIFQSIGSDSIANADAYYIKGIIELYSGNSERANKLFRKGMELDPDNSKCRNAWKQAKKCEELKTLGNEALKSGQIDEAIEHYTKALEIDVNNKKLNSVLYANRSTAYVKKRDFTQGIEECNKSIEQNDKYSKAYLKRGDYNEQIGNYEEAINDYLICQDLDPEVDMKQKVHTCKKKLKQSKQRDYYKILGVEKNATDEEIKKAYRKQALKWHPDRHRDKGEEDKKLADKNFREINDAYQIFSDPKKKELLEQGIDPNDQESGYSSGGGANPNDIFQMFFGGGGGGMGQGQNAGYSFKFG